MIRKIVNRLLYVFSLSGFNTLYKYVLVKESMSYYDANSNFMGAYLTKSNYDIPYLKIFILSLTILILIDVWSIIIIYFVSKKKYGFKEIFMKISGNSVVFIATLLSMGLLFLNLYLSLIILISSFVFYIIKLRKNVTNEIFVVTIISIICSILGLWFISY